MSGAYIVVVARGQGQGEVEACEAYASRDLALARAQQLAKPFVGWLTDNIDNDPPEEVLSNGTIRMTVCDTGVHWVGVYFDVIRYQLNVPNDPLAPLRAFGAKMPDYNAPPFATTYGDKLKQSLPGGWSISGKPITEQELQDFPNNVKLTSELTEDQQFALAIARVRKQPDYFYYDYNGAMIGQDACLLELDNRSDVGRDIMENECADLHIMREDAIMAQDIEDEDSSEYEDVSEDLDDSWNN